MTENRGYVLPAPGQTMVSAGGNPYEVMRVWTDRAGHRGVDLRQVGGRGQALSRRVDASNGWRIRLPRSAGAFRVCPVCEAQFGGVTACPWDDVPLLPLEVPDA